MYIYIVATQYLKPVFMKVSKQDNISDFVLKLPPDRLDKNIAYALSETTAFLIGDVTLYKVFNAPVNTKNI